MKTFQFIHNSKGIEYPVGLNIIENKEAMDNMVKILKKIYPTESIVFWTAGSSGPIIASYVGFALKREFLINHVKPKKSTHHSFRKYHIDRSVINIFIDDFIEDGITLRMIYEETLRYKVTLNAFCLSKSLVLEKVCYLPEIVICGKIYIQDYTILHYESKIISYEENDYCPLDADRVLKLQGELA